MLITLINIITSPQEAFNTLKVKPAFLLPLGLIIVFAALTQILYYNTVSLEVFVEDTLAQTAVFIDNPDAQLRERIQAIDLSVQGITSAIGVAIMLPLYFSIIAGYLVIISKFSNDGIKFKQWFALAVWANLPTLFLSTASMILILTSTDGRISQAQLDPFNLNELFFHTESFLSSLLSRISLVQIWIIILLIIGYQNWSGKKMFSAIFIGTIPYVLFYGTWAFFIIR